MADVQHRAHLTWVEGPQMYLTVQADERVGEDDPAPTSEGYWEVDVTADLEVEETLDVPSGGDRDEAKAAAAAALLAGGWYPHGDWVDEPYETTVIVKQAPADYDTEDSMASVPHPQAELEARLAEVYAQPEGAGPQPSWRERPYTGPMRTAEERARLLAELGMPSAVDDRSDEA
ncbi:hypothetical protein OG592_43325 (plasmid) [Streptomyces avidinii]|uniref:hypothetical protein n=1 Tax=Streptomyces avidinii TaxID=1895 RepID=UPI00386854C4|nr:hypothetical protein OG592_43325 [Streptomyces avidinii]